MFDQNTQNRLHDAILDVFNVDVTNEQINRLLTLCPTWDGIADTLGIDEVMDSICVHFIKRPMVTYGSSAVEKEQFGQAIQKVQPSFLAFINNPQITTQ